MVWKSVSGASLPHLKYDINHKNRDKTLQDILELRSKKRNWHCFLISDRLTPLVFASQPKLLSVNISNNLISDIQSGAFTNMTRLVRLILTKNKITRLEANSLIGKILFLLIFEVKNALEMLKLSSFVNML